ncbi:MAG: hypothetical protein ACLRFH_04500, partial [Opitutales bacterium]
QETATTNNEVKEKPTIANEELKVQVIPDWDAFYERNGFVIQKGMDQYIVECLVGERELNEILTKLRSLHTDKAKKLGKKPIIFKRQGFTNYDEVPIEETDEFSIESFFMWGFYRDIDWFGKCYNTFIKYGKPVVFRVANAADKDEIEKRYDLSKCQIIAYEANVTSFDDYLKFAKLDIENLSFDTIRVFFKPFSEEQILKEKLKLALKYLKGESIEELKKGVELLLGLNLKQEFRKKLYLDKISKAVSNEEFIEILREQKYRLREEIKEFIKVLEKLKTILAEKKLFPITEEKELRKQLHAYVHDNRVNRIKIKEIALTNNYTEGSLSVPIEYASCLKVEKTPIVNPKNTEAILFVPKTIVMMENVTCNTLFCDELEEVGKNVSCKTIICQDLQRDVKYFINCLDKIKNLETVWFGVEENIYSTEFVEETNNLIKPLAEKNISFGFYKNKRSNKLLNAYEDYIEEKDIMRLSGYVNVKNKPDELSDEEWKQVLVLKQKVKEIIDATQTKTRQLKF